MTHAMMTLGEFRFALDTAAYERLVLSQSWRWPKQDRLGRDPALQFIGMEAAEIELEGALYPGTSGSLADIERLRALADAGRPLMLTDGLGRVWGKWCILKVDDVRSVLLNDGQPRKIEFRLALKAYGEDETPARWQPLAGRRPEAATLQGAAVAAPEAIDLAALAHEVDDWPVVDVQTWPEARILEAGETALDALSSLGQALGGLARDALFALRQLPEHIGPALQALTRELLDCVRIAPGGAYPPAQAAQMVVAVRERAADLAAHADLVALAAEHALPHAIDGVAQAAAQELLVAGEQLRARMREIRGIAQKIATRWS
ncbi:MAG: phage tail protein [Rhodocyclaceae bacterium]|nr:phage tail protein [Rhodocyclaceae bacterium]